MKAVISYPLRAKIIDLSLKELNLNFFLLAFCLDSFVKKLLINSYL